MVVTGGVEGNLTRTLVEPVIRDEPRLRSGKVQVHVVLDFLLSQGPVPDPNLIDGAVEVTLRIDARTNEDGIAACDRRRNTSAHTPVQSVDEKRQRAVVDRNRDMLPRI
jgi:hypothetical protein